MAALIGKCEKIVLICDKRSQTVNPDLPKIVCSFLEGQYENFLESNQIANQILCGCENGKPPTDFEAFIKQNLDGLLAEQCEDTKIRDLTILLVAVSCLQLFVQNNWLGPPTAKDPLEFCSGSLNKKVEQEAFTELGIDGETVYAKSRFILYLYIAKIVLLDYRDHFHHLQSWDWWLMRCIVLQQTLLSDKSPTLKATITELMDKIAVREPLLTDDSSRDLKVMFHVEAGHSCHTYYEYKKATEHFETAKKTANIQLELSGAMGKRTRFQQEDKAQLVLLVQREGDSSGASQAEGEDQPPPSLPKILPLDDDTVLNEVAYVNVNVNAAEKISQVEQVLILGLMECYRRGRAVERLTTEEIMTYIAYILKNVTNWNVAVAALCLRSKLERNSRRTVERSMLQFDELSNKACKSDSSPDISSRISLFYAVHVPPVWTVQSDLASLLLSLGLTGEALDVFEKLEMWEDAIACYQKMGKREKAETVIRERLAVEETPNLLCCLGDVTGGLEHYQRAWELSRHRSARAKRCMGYVHFQHENYEKACECFSVSLEINSLQIPVWFSYGCAAMACQKFDVGAKAFKRCVSIDYDNYEAWANLATCYVKLKEKQKAFATIQDALKCNYDNWKLWENNLVIATDCGEFNDVIRSYHRLMDIKDKYVDVEVLNILSRAVVEKLPDANGQPAERLWSKVTELFGRVTARVPSDGDIWASYAKLYSCHVEGKEPDIEKSLGFQQKALKCFTQKVDWEKEVDTCKKVVGKAIAVTETQLQLCDTSTPQDVLKVLPSTRLTLKSTLAKIQKQHTDPITQELAPEVEEMCKDMESTLNNLMERIQLAKSAS